MAYSETMVAFCLFLFLGTIFVCFTVFIIEVLKNKKIDKKTKQIDSVIFNEAIRLRSAWQSYSQFWQIIDYLLIILPFECTAIILYIELLFPNNSDKTLSIFVVSILSMLFMVFSFAFKPHEQMKIYRKAFVEINNTIYQVLGNINSKEEMKETNEKLAKAIAQGEAYINKISDIDGPKK